MAFVPVTDSLGRPVMRSDGTTPRVACADMAEWLFWRDALEVARGRGHLKLFQTFGDAPESFLTHIDGSASDREHVSIASVMDSREMGMAEYPRIKAYGWTGAQHDHGMIPCGHNAHNLYQWTAYLDGYNGLGLLGRGAGDPLPRPAVIRTWQQGIVWAHAEIARLNGTAPATQEDDDMDVYAFTTATGTGYRLRTPLGETDLGSMGEVDSCLSALNSKVTRVWDGTKWVIKTTNACLLSEAAVLEAKLATIRAKSAQPATYSYRCEVA